MVHILALVFVRLFNVFRRNKTNFTRAFAALRVNHSNFLKEKLYERLYINNQRTKQAHYSFICPPFIIKITKYFVSVTVIAAQSQFPGDCLLLSGS